MGSIGFSDSEDSSGNSGICSAEVDAIGEKVNAECETDGDGTGVSRSGENGTVDLASGVDDEIVGPKFMVRSSENISSNVSK